jgi:hypothetical protein
LSVEPADKKIKKQGKRTDEIFIPYARRQFIFFRKPSRMAMVPGEGNSNSACFFVSALSGLNQAIRSAGGCWLRQQTVNLF